MKKIISFFLLLMLPSFLAFGADTRVTALTENTDPQATDLLYLVDDPTGSALSQKMTVATLAANMPDITVLGNDLSVGAAGVKFTGSNGSVTLLGLGNGTDEDLKVDLNAANVATITSSTGVDDIVGLASYSFLATGVKVTGTNGILTLLGLGDGFDEDLSVDFNGASNEITLTSSSGADTINSLANLGLGATGVKLTGTNGTLSILGVGNGQDELITIDLNGTANTAVLSSSTGVVNLSTGAIALTNTSSVTTPAVVLTPTAIASLGAATAGKMVMTSDSGNGTDCTTASGTKQNLCIGDGSAFVFVKAVKA